MRSSRFKLSLLIGILVLMGIGFVYLKNQNRELRPQTGSRVQKKLEQNKKTANHVDKDGQQFQDSQIDIGKLAGTDPGARVQQILRLRQRLTPESVKILEEYLDDPEEVVVSEAIDTLGVLALNNPRLKDQVLKILETRAKNKEFSLRGQALVTAAIVGKEQLLPLVADFIAEPEEESRSFASRALVMINTPACVPYVRDILDKTGDPEVRKNSFYFLGRIATPEAIDILEEYVFSSKKEDVAASAFALSRLNRAESNQMLAEAIKDNKLPEEAIRALMISPGAAEIFGSLLQSQDISKEERLALLKMLSKYSYYGSNQIRSSVVSALEPLLESTDVEIEKAAIKTISTLGGDEAPKLLIQKLKTEDPEVRQEALFAFVGYVTPENYKILFDLLWDDQEKIRRTAMFFLEKFVNESDRNMLERALDHNDEYIRAEAKKLLDQL